MEITSVDVKKVNRDGSLRGFASIVIDDAVAIHDIKICEGDTGLYMRMPSRELPTGKRKDIAHPINQEVRTAIQDAIIKKYESLEDEEKESEEE
jgi:stage V sporulation protein G